MSDKPNETHTKVNLRTLNYSPLVNPLLNPQEVIIKSKRKVSAFANNLTDRETGEIHQLAGIVTFEEVDESHFVKVFATGVSATYNLTKTAFRVFQEILIQYQKMKMSGGYVEDVSLFWFDNKLDGRALDMSEKTFQRGLKELLDKGFLYPKQPSVFWVNPALFFRGDRVRFIKEYQIKKKETSLNSKSESKNSEDNQT
jgi:hypothetical protein